MALVSGSPEKAALVARQYGIREATVHGYEGFERLAEDRAVQAITIALPNAMHREFTERAAAIGRHVLTEKPMATRAEDCRAMIAACERAGVRLMVAHRCQYGPFNRAAQGQHLRLLRREGEHGVEQEPRITPWNQFALELDRMAQCVREGRRPHTPDEEGLRDQLVMEAIYAAAESGRAVPIPPLPQGAQPVRGPDPAAPA